MRTQNLHREEKRRLHYDMATMNSTFDLDSIEDLLLRLEAIVENIEFQLQCSREFPEERFTDEEREDWQLRAYLAVARYKLALGQALRRRDMLERMQSRR